MEVNATEIRRRGYALAELESTIACFFGGVAYLSLETMPGHTAEAAFDMLESATEWQPHLPLWCVKPGEVG